MGRAKGISLVREIGEIELRVDVVLGVLADASRHVREPQAQGIRPVYKRAQCADESRYVQRKTDPFNPHASTVDRAVGMQAPRCPEFQLRLCQRLLTDRGLGMWRNGNIHLSTLVLVRKIPGPAIVRHATRKREWHSRHRSGRWANAINESRLQ